jgi:hypothetical protein
MKRRKFDHEASNRAAARLILLDPARYGEGSLLVRWARAVLARPPEFRPGGSGQLSLFNTAGVAGGGAEG